VTEPFYATRYYKGVKTGDTPSPGKDYLDNEEFDISDARLVEAQADDDASFDLDDEDDEDDDDEDEDLPAAS
jgi:hypothetical protein